MEKKIETKIQEYKRLEQEILTDLRSRARMGTLSVEIVLSESERLKEFKIKREVLEALQW